MSYFNQYITGDHLTGPDGCYYKLDDYLSFIQIGFLGFCGCGRPEDNLMHILVGLRLVDEKSTAVGEEWTTWWKDNRQRMLTHHGNEHAGRLFHYWLDKEGLTEHGSGLPGWLTPKGEELLGLLEEWYLTTLSVD